ncbi:hypothetical protein SAMN04488168_10391 [Bacillus sp. 491mf]|nr:hypothetical protein SAMN04488168_10391 [Bacillus sp. 491mf]
MIGEIDIKKFTVSYLYSLISLIISMNLFGIITSPAQLDWKNIFALTKMLLIYGAPIVLIGCIVGEVLYRVVIIPKSISFKLGFVIYFLLGSIVMLFIKVILGKNHLGIDVLLDLLIGLSTICSVVFFIKRHTYK